MTRDIELCSTQLPTLVENMEKQHKQLINKINTQTNIELNKLRKTQSTHHEVISTLQLLVLSLQNTTPSTPHCQQRVRKRVKQRTPNETLTQEDSEE
jgi:translation initiation factor 2B subunit (eIF-2B alpha/beta/delta family)